MRRVTSGNCVGILSLFCVLQTLRSLTWGWGIIHAETPGVSGICAEACRDSSSYVSRDVATSPSWAQHCSSKAEVSFSALTGLCGTWGMQSVFVYSNFSSVFLLSECQNMLLISCLVAMAWGKELLALYFALLLVTLSCLNLFSTSVA